MRIGDGVVVWDVSVSVPYSVLCAIVRLFYLTLLCPRLKLDRDRLKLDCQHWNDKGNVDGLFYILSKELVVHIIILLFIVMLSAVTKFFYLSTGDWIVA